MEHFLCIFMWIGALIGWMVSIMFLAASGESHKFILAMIILALGLSFIVAVSTDEKAKHKDFHVYGEFNDRK